MDIKSLIKEDYLALQKEETLSSLIGKLKTSGQRNVLVFDASSLLGTLEYKWLMKARLDASKIKIASFLKKLPSLSPETDLIEAAYLMYQSNFSFLPVISGDKFLGVVSGLALINQAAKLEPLQGLAISHLQLTEVPELKPQDPLAAALAFMFSEKLEQLPLTENKKLVGLISYRDILSRYYPFPAKRGGSRRASRDSITRSFTPNSPELDRLPVESFATTSHLMTIRAEDKLTDALGLMYKNNLIDLIVLKNEEVIGLLTLKNILKKIASLAAPPDFNIRFIGLEETRLEPYQKYNLKKIASLEASKLQRELHNQFEVIIHFKEYNKDSKKQKYAINLKVKYPGRFISADKGWSGTWDPETALRKAFRNLQAELKSKFRGDSSRRKPYE